MAHKKGLGSSRNGRDSNPKMLGVKIFSGQEVKVTTTDGNITTTVEVPAGQAANVSIDATVNNSHITENFNIGADGSVRVS